MDTAFMMKDLDLTLDAKPVMKLDFCQKIIQKVVLKKDKNYKLKLHKVEAFEKITKQVLFT